MLKCMVCHFALASDALNATTEDHFQPQARGVSRVRVVGHHGRQEKNNSPAKNANAEVMSLTEASLNHQNLHNAGSMLKFQFAESDDEEEQDEKNERSFSDGTRTRLNASGEDATTSFKGGQHQHRPKDHHNHNTYHAKTTFNEKKLKTLLKMEDVEGIYLLAYKRQLLALAWHFSTSNFG